MKAFLEFRERSIAYLMLRVTLGINFAGHGAIRIYHGTGVFAHQMVLQLAKAPLSPVLVSGFGYFVPWFELVMSIALIVGLFTRAVLISGSLFMMALTIGISANQQWDIAAQQLLYSVVFFILLFSVEYNTYSLDTARNRQTTVLR